MSPLPLLLPLMRCEATEVEGGGNHFGGCFECWLCGVCRGVWSAISRWRMRGHDATGREGTSLMAVLPSAVLCSSCGGAGWEVVVGEALGQ